MRDHGDRGCQRTMAIVRSRRCRRTSWTGSLRPSGRTRSGSPTSPAFWIAEGWLYVSAVIDLFSRRVVGWSMNAGMTAQLVADALLNGGLAARQAEPVVASLRSGQPAQRRAVPATDSRQRHRLQHEPIGERLGQCCHGELLLIAQDRAHSPQNPRLFVATMARSLPVECWINGRILAAWRSTSPDPESQRITHFVKPSTVVCAQNVSTHHGSTRRMEAPLQQRRTHASLGNLTPNELARQTETVVCIEKFGPI